MTDCKFCADYEWKKSYKKKSNQEHNKDPDRHFNLRTNFEVAIVERTWRYGGDGHYVKRAGTSVSGSYPINYCPVCGRELQR